jgi:hypothetical protein
LCTTIVGDGRTLGHISTNESGVPTGSGYVRFLRHQELPNGTLMPTIVLWVPYLRPRGACVAPRFGALSILHRICFEVDHRLTATPPHSPLEPAWLAILNETADFTDVAKRSLSPRQS